MRIEQGTGKFLSMKQLSSYFAGVILLAALLTGCAGTSNILKSGKPDLIYAKALELDRKSVV